MSAFIVISVKDSLNWIVDGIKDSRPHNPQVITHLSTGKIKKTEEDKYLYEYTTYSKHAGYDNADEVLAKTVESDIPRNLFTNQIAQFLNICENQGEPINIFLLDNPITDEDFKQSTWLTDEIRAVYESHHATNFQIVRVLFSYQIDKPTDVTRQVSKMVLKQLTALDLQETDDFYTRILYIDNQNRNGASICLDKDGHDIMLPRMLCDLMMLLSNKDDSYNTAAAINGETQMFAVGYSECMYYHDDVFKYFSLAGNRDLKSYILEDNNDCTSLDYRREPFGLINRQERLKQKYQEVPFKTDINSAPESIDKKIDDMLIYFKDDIIAMKEKALMDAAEADRLATKKARKDKLEELLDAEGEIIKTVSIVENANQELADSDELKRHKGCNFFSRLFHRNKSKYIETKQDYEDSVDPRVKDINITAEYEKVSNEYPEFIDRAEIFRQYTLEKHLGTLFTGTPFEENVAVYKSLIKFIQSEKFKLFLKNKQPVAVQQSEEDNIRSKSKKIITTGSIPVSTFVSWLDLLAKIDSIDVLIKERQEYNKLCTKVLEIKAELEQIEKDITNFRLTSHCSSVDNLIDLDKLKEFHARGKDKRIADVVNKWKGRDEKTRVIESLRDDLIEKTKWDLFDFYYINWDEPFYFIKDIDLKSVCKHLKAKSQPFVNTYTLNPNAENLTSYYFYTDNVHWKEDIQNGRVDLKDTNKVSAMFSSHICSKICMFQFLQMSKTLIEGLVDCY